MKSRVYLETTIPSYLTAWLSRDLLMAAHQQTTQEWWETRRQDFDLFVSQFVIDEAGSGDPDAARRRLEALADVPLLDPSESVHALADALMKGIPLPTKAAADALHIAPATVNGMDYLLTWNCAYRQCGVVREHRKSLPRLRICTPGHLHSGRIVEGVTNGYRQHR